MDDLKRRGIMLEYKLHSGLTLQAIQGEEIQNEINEMISEILKKELGNTQS